jgi:hypothetical protein
LVGAGPESDGTTSLKSLSFGPAGGALIYQLREQKTGFGLNGHCLKGLCYVLDKSVIKRQTPHVSLNILLDYFFTRDIAGYLPFLSVSLPMVSHIWYICAVSIMSTIEYKRNTTTFI